MGGPALPAREVRCEYLRGGTPVFTDAAHRFGTDALLLSWFCAPRPNESACDLGSGCGILPLRWHDAGHRGPCLAVELQPQGTALLRQALSTPCRAPQPFGHAAHIRPLCADLRTADWAAACGGLAGAGRTAAPGRFDLVACNPPYFAGGPAGASESRALARHQLCCTLPQVAAAAAALLRGGGRLCLCQRPAALAQVIAALTDAGLQPKRLCFVRSRPERVPWLFLLEARASAGVGLRLLPDVVLRQPDGTPSPAARAVCGD